MKIIATGLSARFTDLGRVGHKHKGFTQSGALDTNSHLLANAIVGMPFTNPTIEVLLGGFIAVATHDIQVAITGAQVRVLINDVPQRLNHKLDWQKGATLQIMQPVLGARNYIACDRPFIVSVFLDSCCAVTREKTGGMNFDGKGFQVADVLDYEGAGTLGSAATSASTDNLSPETRLTHGSMNNEFSGHNTATKTLAPTTQLAKEYVVRVVLGYQESLFDHKMKACFFNQQFTVSNEASNMGIRLTGKSIGSVAVTLYSEGIANGAIQITPSGLPIIMLAERQTIGGYPKIGSIIAADLPELGQCQPGSAIRFEQCDLFTARQAWLLRQIRIKTFAQNQYVRDEKQ
nr:biotin-dependent carboxyltransferase family protein [uncultured Glaciecola sp.]